MKKGAAGPTPDLFGSDAVPYSERERPKSVKQMREAIKAASDNAERVRSGWHDDALRFLKAYGQTHADFICEDVRHWAEDRGFDVPPSKRSWGGVMLRGEKLGIIERIGVGNAADAHQAVVKRWRLKK
jgi:hypothetical protein